MLKLRLPFLILIAIFTIIFFNCRSTEFNSAMLYIQEENYPKAIESLEKEIQKNPQNDEAYYLLGLCYSDVSEFEKMNEHFKNSLAISNKFQKDISFIKKRYWIYSFNLGLEKLQYDQLDEAIIYFNTAIVIDPNETNTYKNLAFLFAQKGDHDRAIASYQKVIELDPNDFRTLLTLGIEYYNLEKYKDAVNIFNKILEKEYGNSDAIVYLALSYDQLGNRVKALELYEAAIEKNPNDVDLYFNRGRLFYIDKKYENALLDFEQVFKIEPFNSEIILTLGNIYKRMAEKIHKQIEELTKQKDESQKIEELKKMEKEYYQKSKEMFEKIIPQNSKSPEFWHNLGNVYFQLGLIDESKKALKKAEQFKNN
jgi:tetratricopeptide (TPR) repeat protein